MAKQKEKPKLTEQEKLDARLARWTEEEKKISRATAKLVAKQQRQANLQAELKLERSAALTVREQWVAELTVADNTRADLRHHEANVRRLEYALGLRKRGAAAEVGQPPADATEAAPDAPAGDGGAAGEGGETDAD